MALADSQPKLTHRKLAIVALVTIGILAGFGWSMFQYRVEKLEAVEAIGFEVGHRFSTKQMKVRTWGGRQLSYLPRGNVLNEELWSQARFFADEYYLTDAKEVNYDEFSQKLRGWPCGRVVELSLVFLPVSDADFRKFPKFPRVETLTFVGDKFTDAGIPEVIERFPSLKSLRIMSSSITDEGLAELCSAFSDLTKLHIRLSQISDSSVLEIIALSDLEELSIGSRSFEGGNIEKLQSLPNLRKLSLSYILSGNLANLGKGRFPATEVLRLDSVRLSEADLSAIAKAFPNLRELRIRQAYPDSPAVLKPVQSIATLDLLEFYLKKGGVGDGYEKVLTDLNVNNLKVRTDGLSKEVLKRINTVRKTKGFRSL